MRNEGTLLYKIYKAKYFPKVSIFESNLGTNPSYAYRGIWEAKKLLLQGCRWKVGYGKSVKIWIDVWISRHRAKEVDNKEDIVDNLIDRDTMWWKVEKVRALFNPIVAADILKIILCLTYNEDQWIWTH